MIKVETVAKHFGKVKAVSDVSLDAADGKVTALLGPNGAGKSTTLRMIAGAIRPDTGRVLVDGRDVAVEGSEAIRHLGVLPYGAGVYPRLTGRENIRYFGALLGLAGSELDDRVDSLVRQLQLDNVADRPAKGYSQGEKMKVCVGRALVHSPRNIILDEPTNGLDVYALRSLREMVRGLREDGHCVLFSSHVMQEVSALCDRIVVIADGRIIADGDADSLREQFGEEDLEEVFIKAVTEGAA
ncbi:MAG: ATP-binding cassette domain-containing protein [Gammaproteobacteria bacterium]|nr:ATP-binding cassette domain-containing protein [Gammaproteobacteria bacterium]